MFLENIKKKIRVDPPRIELGSLPCKGNILPLDYGPNDKSCFLSFLIFSVGMYKGSHQFNDYKTFKSNIKL